MRVLLTGTNGQVGSALLPLLTECGAVVAPSRADFDLSKPEALAERLNALKPDFIINPAAYTAVDRAEDETEIAFLVNAKGPAAIAQWAARSNVPLIHFSTDYVFDGSGNKPWREDSPTGPISVYGASKLAGDMAVAAAKGPHLILRTSWVYAANGVNFLRTIARLAKERAELKIVVDQIGAPTSATTIANAVIAILKNNMSDLDALFAEKSGVVNLVCAGETSWHAFAKAIVTGLKSRGFKLAVENIFPISSAEFPTKARRPRNSRLDLSRLEDVFGITTPNWLDALQLELDGLVQAERPQ